MPEQKSKPQSNPKNNPFLSESAEACFRHFSKLVMTSPPAEVERWNADPEIVRVNVGRGVDAASAHMAHIGKALPLLDRDELLELPALARAVAFAADRVVTPASPGQIRARQQRLRPMRSMTLGYLEIAADLGLVPADRVAKIRAGSGPIDEARDAVAIAALFNEHGAALENKHPFSKASLMQLAEDGDWLLSQLVPSSAAPQKGEQNRDARLRDLLWTELVRRYDHLYQAGVAVWGRRKVDEHIPALLARSAARPKETAAPTPPPAPLPA